MNKKEIVEKIVNIHLYERNGFWYFWDESGTNSFGPYETKKDANKNFIAYSKYLDYKNTVEQ